jgi:hypothetical protein
MFAKNSRVGVLFHVLLVTLPSAYVDSYSVSQKYMMIDICYVRRVPFHHSMVRPEVADGGTASNYGG